jgi:hypothetical protein
MFSICSGPFAVVVSSKSKCQCHTIKHSNHNQCSISKSILRYTHSTSFHDPTFSHLQVDGLLDVTWSPTPFACPYSWLFTLYHRAVDLSECGRDYRVKTNNSISHPKNEFDIQSFISMLKGMKTWDDYTLQTAGQAPSLRSLMSLFQAPKSHCKH